MSVIGPLTGGLEVERGVLKTLRAWLPTYLKDAIAQAGLKPNAIQPVKSWSVISEHDRWPEANLPAVIIAAPGLRGNPEKGGDGSYRVVWQVAVSIVIGAATGPKARKYAQVYAAAIRGAILQRRSLGDEMRATDWVDEGYTTISHTDKRTVVGAALFFDVEQNQVVNWRLGPKGDEPPKEVPAEVPEVTEIDVEMEIEP